jgi:hypothetical protein
MQGEEGDCSLEHDVLACRAECSVSPMDLVVYAIARRRVTGFLKLVCRSTQELVERSVA